MKEEEIKELFEQFEAIANEYEGVECWSARELAQVLGYSQWRNFEGIIEKAKASMLACQVQLALVILVRIEPADVPRELDTDNAVQ